MRHAWIGRLAIALFLFGCGEQAFAQTILQGRVTDSQGGAINGALVTLGGAQATSNTTRTGADGTFSFDGVPAGTVNVQVEAPGFESTTQSIAVAATMVPVTIVLRIAGVVESIGVVAPRLEEELPQLIERGASGCRPLRRRRSRAAATTMSHKRFRHSCRACS